MLDGLLFQPAGTETTNQTRAGIPIYRGGPLGFEEWKFKIRGRVQSIQNQCREDDAWSVIERDNKLVVEALEDDALKVAIEMGHDVLSTPEGVTLLVQRIEDAIPYGDKEDDARDLYISERRNAES